MSAAARAGSRGFSTSSEPEAEIWGLDISAEMLRFVPPGIHTRAGYMTELPFADGFFDAAYATESLEHAVEIEKAVSEICRVVKPGGRIAIIDKNAEHWGRVEDSRVGEMVHSAKSWSGCYPAIAVKCRAASSLIGKM